MKSEVVMQTFNTIRLCAILAFSLLASCRTESPRLKVTAINLPPQIVQSSDEAAARAASYAEKMHLNLSDKESPVVERHRTPNTDVLSGDDASGYKAQLRAKLVGKDYWAVHYKPRQLQLGGDQVFFVEASTGALLGHYAGR
jgi:hypothetical protein